MGQKAVKKIAAFIKGLPSACACMPRQTVDFFKTNAITLGLMVLSAILLTVIHPPLNLSWLAWVAWVPFIIACRPDLSIRRLLICAYLIGVCFWIGNMYWLMIVSMPGYITFSFVYALYWPLLALSVRFVRQQQWSLFLTAPIIFVGAEAVQGVVFTGFSWYYLAHSQYEHLRLIQICDIFGALGVSVLIAAANGLLANLILSRLQKKSQSEGSKRLLSPGVCKCIEIVVFHILLFTTLLYGHKRLTETPNFQKDGPILGSVQPNVPAWVKEEMSSGQELLDDLIADSEEAFAAGAKLVCWPETMVLAPMNPKYRALCVSTSAGPVFHQRITEHTNDKGYVLFGAHTAKIGYGEQNYPIITDQYNSAYLYKPDGTADPKIYHKIHLVPFGEFIPFKKSAPWIYKMILWLSPYDYDYNLTAGEEYTIFEIDTENDTFGFGVLICYEDTDPTVTRRMVLDENYNKKADWLVNISNDGWYVHFKERQVIPMVELAQRTAISVFRCIENRISIIRSVNTGISCLIEPTGKIRDSFEAGNLPEAAMDRQGVAGWFTDTVPIDSRVTFFGKYGRWLDVVLGLGWIIILLWPIYNRTKKR